MPGIRDSGAFELVGTLRLDHESQNNSETVGPTPGPAAPGGLIYLQRTRAIVNFAISLPDDTLLPFRGYVSRFQIGAMGITGLLNFTAAIMPTESYSADLPPAAIVLAATPAPEPTRARRAKVAA